MTRKTPTSGWMAKRWIAVTFLCGLVAVYLIGRAISPAGAVTFAVLGDHADELRAGLGIDQSIPATVTIVTLNRWDSLRHVPDLAAVCGAACGTEAAGQVSVVQMRFGRSRKIVFFHLPDFENRDCVIARARQELSAMRLTGDLPCAPDVLRDAVWQLPAGLGRV